MSVPKNPLVIPEITEVILKHVTPSMWKTFRLVCKTWHDELLPHWRKEMTVLIGGLGRNNLISEDDYDKTRFMDVPSFLETYQPEHIRQWDNFPIRSIKTAVGRVTIGKSRRNNDIQHRFWALCGSCLHNLHFHGVIFKDLEILEKIIFELTPTVAERNGHQQHVICVLDTCSKMYLV